MPFKRTLGIIVAAILARQSYAASASTQLPIQEGIPVGEYVPIAIPYDLEHCLKSMQLSVSGTKEGAYGTLTINGGVYGQGFLREHKSQRPVKYKDGKWYYFRSQLSEKVKRLYADCGIGYQQGHRYGVFIKLLDQQHEMPHNIELYLMAHFHNDASHIKSLSLPITLVPVEASGRLAGKKKTLMEENIQDEDFIENGSYFGVKPDTELVASLKIGARADGQQYATFIMKRNGTPVLALRDAIIVKGSDLATSGCFVVVKAGHRRGLHFCKDKEFPQILRVIGKDSTEYWLFKLDE